MTTRPSPTTYGLLGMLATRSWTGYALTRQLRRSLRFVWSSSEGHLYREQRRLVALGWASVEDEPAGQRSRKRYTITEAGRQALSEWLSSEPEEPHFEVEGVLRTFFGNHSSPAELAATMTSSAAAARAMRAEMASFVEEYLQEGGPLTMLERGPTTGEQEFHGRSMFPERLHVVALSIDITTRLLETLDAFFTESAAEVASWPSTSDASLTPQTRARLERIRSRAPRTTRAP